MTRIMLVDDELDTLTIMQLFLELSGYQSCSTADSAEAIQLADMEHPDVVMLDVMMPGLDGFSLCKLMREHPTTANLPIMFVTAYSAQDIEHRRVESGGDMILPKPFGMDEMSKAIEKVLMLRQAAALAAPKEAPKDVTKEAPKEASKEAPAASPFVTQTDKSVVIRQNSAPEVYLAAISHLLAKAHAG